MEQRSFGRGQLVIVEGIGFAQVTRTVDNADKVPCRWIALGVIHDMEFGVEMVKAICPNCTGDSFSFRSWAQGIPSHWSMVNMLFCSKSCAEKWGSKDLGSVYQLDIAPLPMPLRPGAVTVASIDKDAGQIKVGSRLAWKRTHDLVVDEYMRKKAEHEIPPVFEMRRAWWDDYDRLGETDVGFQALLLWDTDEEAQAFIKAKAESCPGCPECEGPFEPGHVCPTTLKRRREVSRTAWQRDEGGRRTACVERALAMEDARALLED